MAEKDLYPAVIKSLERQGYKCVEQFPLQSVTEAWKYVDVAAFRWRSEVDVEAVAVEVKDGDNIDSILAGIPQAIIYQTSFSWVAVASRCKTENARVALDALRSLGLGYVHCVPNRATICYRGRSEERTDAHTFDQNIVPIARLFLFAREVLGNDWRNYTCSTGSGYFWLWSSAKDRFQIQIGCDDNGIRVGVFSQIKWVTRRAGDTLDPGKLSAWLDEFLSGGKPDLHISHGYQNVHQFKWDKSVGFRFTTKNVSEALKWIINHSNKKNDVAPVALRVYVPGLSNLVRRNEGVECLQKYIGRAKSLADRINGNLGLC